MIDLAGRHFLKEVDFTPDEWNQLVALTRQLKAERRSGTERQRLAGKNLALIFEKASTRTRAAFEVAARHQGAFTTYLDPAGSHIGAKESAADTACVLSRMYDGIEFRGNSQDTVETLAEFSSVPVWNGLTDEWHPTQSLCDAFTMVESAGRPGSDIAFAYLGDARFNMGNSMLVMGAMMGMDVRLVAPAAFQPDPRLVSGAREIASMTGGRVTVTDDVAHGVEGADFVHTDVWVSMGEPKGVWAERCRMLAPYRVTRQVMEATGKPEAKFMHCLPAFHDLNTSTARIVHDLTGMRELEVSDEVFNSEASLVFEQAENRLHSIKAVLVATLSGC
ncbi:ornithine carbamoyltransferase [Propioniciclava soli]|uniref:ornithine carbamoyltransferase n=1 Tax=Propioniciclava soli TaxID=2775081 RepID=UPI001E39DF06